MTKESQARYSELIEKITDLRQNNFLAGDGEDKVCNVMCCLYPAESRAVAIKSGDMSEEDEFEAIVPLDDLFKAVENQGQFVEELDSVIIHTCKAQMDTRELIEFILSYR